MRIAITTSGSDLNSPLDTRFGRALNFVIYETDFGTYHLKHNEQNLNAAQGAGIQTALHLKQEKVDCVISGNCGPKAFATLEAAGIAIYTSEAMPVCKVIEQFKAGKLTKAERANVEAHWA